MDINEIAQRQFDWVERMGWHNKTVLEALALIASEIGELANEVAFDEPGVEFGTELADIVLRTADLAKWQRINLAAGMSRALVITTPLPHVYRGIALLVSDIGKIVNCCRKESIDQDFGHRLSVLIKHCYILAEFARVDLDQAIENKMAINEQRGTRGRVI